MPRSYYLLTPLFILSFITACAQKNTDQAWYRLLKADSINNARTGTEYLAFSARLLNGDTIDNHNLSGKITLLDFWFMGCKPCLEQSPVINQIYNDLKNDSLFQVYGITFDPPEVLPGFVKEHNIQYPIATVPSSKVSHQMNFGNSFPTYILLDEQGKILHIWKGVISYKKDPPTSDYNLYKTINDALNICRTKR